MFDWIDRVQGLLSAVRYGGGTHTFRIKQNDANCGADYEAMLKRRGVAVFGRRFTSKLIIFSVKRRQARWAEHILVRAGAPIVSKQVDASNTGASERHGGTLPVPWSEAKKGKR
jgi:hypothetical protein